MQFKARWLFATVLGLLLITASQRVRAEDHTALMVGGGVAAFSDEQIAERVDTGGTWDLRLLFGVYSMLALEAAYVGTANSVQVIGSDTTLTSHGLEGALRLSTPGWLPVPIQVYGFIGAGFARFDLSGAPEVGSEGDTSFVVPFGAGLQLNMGPYWVADARFTYRAMFDDELFGDPAFANGETGTDMYTLTARLGFVF